MADSFSFESGKKFNKKNFSFTYDCKNSMHKKNINKLIKFFDKDENGRLSSNNYYYYDKSSEATSLFKIIKKYIKDDGIFSDEEIGDFLSKHKELEGVSVTDFKNFINGKNGYKTTEITTTEGTTSLSVEIFSLENYKEKKYDTKVLPTKTTITKSDSKEIVETILKHNRGVSDKPIYNKTTNYDENNNILNISETKYEYGIYYHDDGSYLINSFESKSVTETMYENGQISQVIERKYSEKEANLVEEKISYYTDGVLTSATKTQYIDGKTIIEEISYDKNFPVKVEKYINGELSSTSTLEKGSISVELTLENGRKGFLSYPCTLINSQNTDGTSSETFVTNVDINGSYSPEDFLRKKIIRDNNITEIEKYAINEINTENKTTKTIGYKLVEKITNIDNTRIENIYNSDNIHDYDAGNIFLTAQSFEDGNAPVKTCFYDGKGNTYIVLQNGDCPSLIEKTFKPEDMSKEDFWTETYRLNLKNFDEKIFKWDSSYKESILNHEKYNYIVGTEFLIKGEISANDEKILSRNPAEDEIKEYNDWYYNEITKNVTTSQHENYILNKDYKNAYELAKDILENKFNKKYITKTEINDYVYELKAINGDLSEKLKSGTKLEITNFNRIDKNIRQEFDKLGISTNNSENLYFFTHFSKLDHHKQKDILKHIEEFRSKNQINGNFNPKTFEELKDSILEEKGICLTNSGIYIENNANIWKDVLTSDEKKKYDNKKITLENFIKEIGLDHLKPNSEGEKLYNILCNCKQEYLNVIPFGILINEINTQRANNIKITTDMIFDLVEQLTLFNCSIRVVNGKLDSKTIEQKRKETQNNPPEIIRRFLEKIFQEALKSSKEALKDVDSDTAWYQSTLNWFAERFEAAGLDTDNRKDVIQEQNGEERLIKLFSSNPAGAFKALTGLEFTYENIVKVLKGEFQLDSIKTLKEYNINLNEYKAWTKAIVISLASIAATFVCPISAFASAGYLGHAANYALNLAKTCTLTGFASVGYDLLDKGKNFDFLTSFKEGVKVSGLMCIGNTAGSLIMRSFLPKIGIASGTTFETICIGNTYNFTNVYANATCYVFESAFQNCAIAGLAGRNMADYKEYMFSIFAGTSALKIMNFSKTNNVAAITNVIENTDKNLLLTIGATSFTLLRDGSKYILQKSITNIGDTFGNTSEGIDILKEDNVTQLQCEQKNIEKTTWRSKQEVLEYINKFVRDSSEDEILIREFSSVYY